MFVHTASRVIVDIDNPGSIPVVNGTKKTLFANKGHGVFIERVLVTSSIGTMLNSLGSTLLEYTFH